MTDGHILTETYLSLRRLENEVIRERYHGQTMTESQCAARHSNQEWRARCYTAISSLPITWRASFI